jgi:Fic family protein
LTGAIRGSNTIEGFSADLDTAVGVVEDEPPIDGKTATILALAGYREALTYIMQAARDQHFEFSKQFLKSLHFMMTGHDMSKFPGQWRPGSIFVVDQDSGTTVYEGPDAELVNGLVEELVLYLKADTQESVLVRGAMAHLNLTMIHPFKDGNGRMARALQTLILARDGMLHPVFSSIEEWLGRNTPEYYQVLAETGDGHWSPERDTLRWVRFCLKAHYQQAATLIRRNEEYGEIFEAVMRIIRNEHLPERAWFPMFDAALGLRVINSRYRKDAEISEFVASRDLRRLCELGLLEPIGERRARVYIVAGQLKALRTIGRKPRPVEDPYKLVARRVGQVEEAAEPLLPF